LNLTPSNPTDAAPGISNLTTDDQYIYWSNQFGTNSTLSGWKLQKMLKGGGSPIELAEVAYNTSSYGIYGIQSKGGNVYWLKMVSNSNSASGYATVFSNQYSIQKTNSDGTTSTLTSFNLVKTGLMKLNPAFAVEGTNICWVHSKATQQVDTSCSNKIQTVVRVSISCMPTTGGSITLRTYYDSIPSPCNYETRDTYFTARDEVLGSVCLTRLCEYGMGSTCIDYATIEATCLNSSSLEGVISRTRESNVGVGTVSGPTVSTSSHLYLYTEWGIAQDHAYGSNSTYLDNSIDAVIATGDTEDLIWFGTSSTTPQNSILQAPIGGGSVTQIAPYSATNLTSMTSDGSYVYWTDSTYIRRAPKL
jgi:hypothetical protein